MTDTKLTVLLDIQTSSLKRQVQKKLLTLRDVSVLDHALEAKGDVLIAELSSTPDSHFQAIQEILESGNVGDVFLLSSNTEQSVLLRSIRVGVKEFLTLPLNEDELSQAVSKLQARRRQQLGEAAQAREGKVITVMGSKGGAGTTTVAVNLAVSLAERDPAKSVLLLDMNVNLGEVPLFLDFKPQFNWGDLAKNLKRMDETYMRNVLHQHSTGLCILPGPEHVNGNFMELRDLFGQMLTLLRSMFDFVVIDAGHSLSDLGQQAALASDTVFVVSQLSLPYLANTNKVLGTLKNLLPAPDKRIRVIVNRHDKKGEVSMHEAESSLQTEIFWSLPADYKFATSAINQGKPLSQVGPRHKLTRSMQDLAAKMSPETGEKEGNKKKWFFR